MEFKKDRKLRVELRVKQKDFTIKRKVGFMTLIYMILNMVKRTTQIEIDEFLEKFEARKGKKMTYTRQSFSEARQQGGRGHFVCHLYYGNVKWFKKYVYISETNCNCGKFKEDSRHTILKIGLIFVHF